MVGRDGQYMDSVYIASSGFLPLFFPLLLFIYDSNIYIAMANETKLKNRIILKSIPSLFRTLFWVKRELHKTYSSLNQINQPKSRQPARIIYSFHYTKTADPNTFNPFRVYFIGHPLWEVVILLTLKSAVFKQ